jgi:hypothetical protein
MAKDVEIEVGGRRLGTIVFDEGPQRLNATRTASGFTLGIPATVRLTAVKKGDPRPVVARLWGEVLAPALAGGLINVGHFRHRRGGILRTAGSTYFIRVTGTSREKSK